MQTHFSAEQLAEPAIQEMNGILRSCVHCGMCTSTCPTYVLLGDELDSPRGRIYLVKAMLESGAAPSPEVVKHVDRCLSCLGCMTSCPSGVNYMHLIDHARSHIETTYRRPLADRLTRAALALVLPRPALFRLAMRGAMVTRPLTQLIPGRFRRLKAMLALAPRSLPTRPRLGDHRVFPASSPKRRRVALAPSCAQEVLAPEINAAAVRLLNRLGCEVVTAAGSGCCGALVQHLGRESAAAQAARSNIAAWMHESERGGLDAIVVTAAGCGTMVKDYGHLLRSDSRWASQAAHVSSITLDVTELLGKLDTDPAPPTARAATAAPSAPPGTGLVVAYHSACSLQHGQKIDAEPRRLLRAAGFELREIPEGHLCCGSAGTYNLLEPELASQLRDRKIERIERVTPDVIATGNIGCLTQLASGTTIPVVHTVQLLDWATGGPRPRALAGEVTSPAPTRPTVDC